jgi:glycosyltransferase involved in cell wall biosynthesis
LAIAPQRDTSISIENTRLSGRKIFVYVGNMGVAQGMDIFIDLAERLLRRQDIGFLFVGRGAERTRLENDARTRGLDNVLFHEEIDSREIPGLLAQCCVGLLALDPRHRTHNIPGKFLTYLQAGLPILARINPGTDLVKLIEEENVGIAYVGESIVELEKLAERLASDENSCLEMAVRGRELGRRMFSPTAAVEQIVASLSSG